MGDAIDLDPAHGTFVAGVVRQVAPHAQLHVVRTFDATGACTDPGAAARLLEARRVIAANAGRGVVNLSWGCAAPAWAPPLATTSALSQLVDYDIAVVGAAGNAGLSRIWFPAACEGVVAVARSRSTPRSCTG